MAEKELFDEVEQWQKEIIILEPGSDKKLPEHDVQACGRCTYVSGKENIVITPQQKRAAMIIPCDEERGDNEFLVELLKKNARILTRRASRDDFIVELGLFAVSTNPGHQMWYLFQCANCNQFSKSYVSGYSRYLNCEYCDGRVYPKEPLPGERD